MNKTLYLHEKDGLTVERDGPSLWIKERYRAGRRVPIRLIDAAIIRGNIKLESGVITSLVENNIPVTLLSRRGNLIAAVFRVNTPSNSIMGKIAYLRESKKGMERVRIFLNARRRKLMIKVLKTFQWNMLSRLNEKGLNERDYYRILRNLLPQDDTKSEIISAFIEGLFFEIALKKIIAFKIDPHTGFIHRHHEHALAKDILYVLEPERDRQVLQFFRSRLTNVYMHKKNGKWVLSSEGIKNIVVRFENHKDRILLYLDLIFEDFFNLVRECRI